MEHDRHFMISSANRESEEARNSGLVIHKTALELIL